MADKPSDKLAVKPTNTALEPAPDYFKAGDRRGVEHITKQDVLIPRLALAQALSPQVTEGDPNRIEGLQAGDLFNSMTGQQYGREVFVQIIRKDRLRAMEFRPVNDGGGVIDPDVPIHDPRLKWGAEGEKPVATLFRDYLACILPGREMIALSFKSSGIKVAKTLNGLIVNRYRPIFAGRYVITTGSELKPKPHKVFLVDNAGWVSAEDAQLGEALYEAVKDMDMQIDRDEREDDDPDSFDPAKLERADAQM